MSDRPDPLPRDAVILAIETSIRPGTVALSIYRSERLDRHERREIETDGRRQAAAIVSVANELCGAAGSALKAVTAVGISSGPGSFTGLRVGMTFAKTLAHTNGIPLFGFPTLRVVADWHLLATPGRCRVLTDAQGGFVFAQDWTRLGEDFDELTAVGEIARVTIADAERGFADEELVRIPDTDDNGVTIPHAGIVAALTSFAVGTGDDSFRLDPVAAEPLYVRKSGAEEKAEATRGPEAPDGRAARSDRPDA